MKQALINGELKVNYPDNFEVWDDEKMRQIYGDNDNHWAAQDENTGIVIDISWLIPKGFSAKQIAKSSMAFAKTDEINMKKQLKGQYYKCKGFKLSTDDYIEYTSYELEYEYNGIMQAGYVGCLSYCGTCYKVFGTAMKEYGAECGSAVNTVLTTIRPA